MRKLYLKSKKRGKLESLESFLRSLFSEECIPSTYVDKECTTKECDSGASRSLEAILAILRSQYKYVSIRKVVNILYDIAKTPLIIPDPDFGSITYTYAWIYCDDISKWVYADFAGTYLHNTVYNYNGSIAEHYDERGKGEYSLEDIIAYCDHLSMDDLEEAKIDAEEEDDEEGHWEMF